MVIIDYLERNADQCPDEIALVEINPQYEADSRITWKDYALMQPEPGQEFRREMTWKTFDDRANQIANLLFTRGIKKGDKIGILMMNSIEWLPIYFGILKTGGVAVPLNYRYAADEIKYCLDKADISMLVFGPEFVGRIEQIVDDIPDVRHLFYVGEDCPGFAENLERLQKFCSKDRPHVPLTLDDDAVIYYSSGTTGFPKAILHAHRSLMHAANCEQHHHGQTHDDVFLCIPPLYHTGAKMHWMGSLVSCSKGVLLKGTKPEWILKAISDERCTIVWLLVPWAQDIMDKIDSGVLKKEDYHLDQWRLMHIGAQPVPNSLIRHWLEIFPNHDYDTNYGLSESTGPGCIHLGVGNQDHAPAIGIPGWGWEIKLCDEEGNEVPTGTPGEIWIKGPAVMKCYYNDEKATAESLHGDWLLSGDMAQKDEDGFIHIVDRKKDVIIMGGENIYPVQIEEFLHGMNQIKDVAVIGVPDKRLGEITLAIIEVKEGFTLTEEEVNKFCVKLPRYKRPRKIVFDPVLRNATGKIQKPEMRKKYAAADWITSQTI